MREATIRPKSAECPSFERYIHKVARLPHAPEVIINIVDIVQPENAERLRWILEGVRPRSVRFCAR